MFQLGAGYQLTDDLYASATYEKYDVDLYDGNTPPGVPTARIASGQHDKNKFIVNAATSSRGAEFGLICEYAWGDCTPTSRRLRPERRRGTGDRFQRPRRDQQPRDPRVPPQPLKAFMKVQF
jgi:hypothetical protein